MAGRTLAGSLGLTGDWDLGENNWKDDNDVNLLKLSVVAQGVASELVSATPGAPTEGLIVLFDDTHPTNAGDIAVYDEAAWHYISPATGWRMYDSNAGFMREFDGSTWVEVTSGGGGIEEAPEDGNIYGRKNAAWEEVTGGGGSGGGIVGMPSVITSHSSSTTNLFMGSRLLPFVDMTIDGIAWEALKAVSGTQQFQLHIVTVSNASGAGNIDTVLATSDPITVTGTGNTGVGGVVDIDPLALTAGTQYAIIAEQLATDSTRIGIAAANSMLCGLPALSPAGMANTIAFAPGAAFLNSGTPYALGVRTASS